MRAVRLHGRGDLRTEERPTPVPADDQALVAVTSVGLCGSDLEEFQHGPVASTLPVTLGHEVVGVVERAAADGSGPPAGTRVVVDIVTGCGHCWWCRQHEEGQCPELVVTGLDVDGGLAELVLGRAGRLVVVPPDLDPVVATLAEPLACAVRALRKVGDVEARGIAVIGGGTIGLLVAQAARAAGAGPVVVVEPSGARRALCARLGLVAVWDDDAAERGRAVSATFPERGVDIVVECTGRTGQPGFAIELVRPGGDVVLLGVDPEPQELDTLDLVLREKTVHGSAAHMYDVDVAAAVELLASGAVDGAPLLTHRFRLEETGHALAVLADPAQGAVKVVVEPGVHWPALDP